MKKWKTQLLAAALAAVASMPSAPWESGVYQDKAAGYGGDVILTVTIRDGRIRTLETENTGGEKSEYYLKAEEALIAEILEKQSLEGIDTVAGATGTSESILSAMQGIWEQMNYTGTPSQEPVNSVKEPTLTAWPKPTV